MDVFRLDALSGKFAAPGWREILSSQLQRL
jgi:hypothetical protein